jgi:serine/threonine-protein kinase
MTGRTRPLSAAPDAMAAPPTTSDEAKRRAHALVGQTLDGRYRVDDVLAMGAMGTVYLARHLKLKKRVALKVLHPDVEDHPELVARFEREAQAGARVSHPNVAAATDFGELDDGTKYLVMEYVRGSTLRAVLDAQAPLSSVRAVRIARQIAVALDEIHARGIVHRDLKPRNVMLSGEDFVKVVDFGLSKLEHRRDSIHDDEADGEAERITGRGMVFGTVDYMAPEAAFGMELIDARADLFALGVIFYEMLAGKHPYDGATNLEVWTKIRSEPIPRFRARAPEVDVDPRLEAIVRKLLEKDYDDRHQSAAELIRDLDDVEPEGSIVPPEPRDLLRSLPPPSSAPRSAAPPPETASTAPGSVLAAVPRPSAASRPGWRPLVALGVAAAVAVVAYAAGRGSDTPASAPGGDAHVGAAAAPAADDARVATSPTAAESAGLGAPPAAAPPASSASGAASVAPTPLAAPSAPADPSAAATAREKLVASTNEGRWDDAADAALALLGADPQAPARAGDQRTLRELMQALERARHPRTAEVWRAVALAPGGADLVYRFAETGGRSAAAVRASELLRDADVQERASPALRIAFALREASCADKLLLLDRAVAEGDERAVVSLQVAKACFKKSHSVDQAQKRLRQRLGGR